MSDSNISAEEEAQAMDPQVGEGSPHTAPERTPYGDIVGQYLVQPLSDQVSKGFATKLGVLGIAVSTAAAAVQPVLEGDHTGETKFYAVLGTIFAVVTVAGRMFQSAAKMIASAKAQSKG